MHDTAHGRAPKAFSQNIEFLDEGVDDVARMQQIDRDEMFGDQDFVVFGITLDPVTEQTAWEIVSLTARDHDTGLAVTSDAGGVLSDGAGTDGDDLPGAEVALHPADDTG